MTSAEAKLLSVIFLVVSSGSWLSRVDIRKTLTVYTLGCLAGFAAQLWLGPELNRYTPNISRYVSYVSVAVVFAWGTGLCCIWMVHLLACRIFKLTPNLLTHLLSGVPVILILEAIGSNIIVMKLHDYKRYESLVPPLNAMHAPAWLYGYYLMVSLVFYFFLKALSLNEANRKTPRV
ncbi:MAG: hypothetical protein M1541_09455 [Acidobacteria bacterium]|nr:hypothetical protein [Acidobacteriota bacterium]